MLRIQKLLSLALIALAGCSGANNTAERSVADFMHLESAELKGIVQACTNNVKDTKDMTLDCVNALQAQSRKGSMENRCWKNGVDHACVDQAGYKRK